MLKMNHLAVVLMLVLAGCGSQPAPRSSVVYTSSEGIAFQSPSGAVHFYRFKSGTRGD
jgi:PBP1b-binding outer membrane lipoprotein LpoB